MMIGGFSHSAVGNGCETAQNFLKPAWGLAWGEFPANNLPVGETAIPVASAKHLFRTPSLGGQAGGISTDLPVTFLSAAAQPGFARGFAHFRGFRPSSLRRAHFMSSVTPSGTDIKRGWAECVLQRFGLHWHWLAGLRPAVTRSANKPLSVARSGRALRRCLTATWRPVRLLVLRATCCSVSKTPAAADTPRDILTGHFDRISHTHAYQTAGRGHSARGFSRAFPLKTKDVPCSTRS